MQSPIRMFGTSGPLPLAIVPTHASEPVQVTRELWFDQDTDGRWLVVAVNHDTARHNGFGEQREELGSIVVTDPRVVAFIEMLADLVVEPARFEDEPRFGDDA